MNNKGLTLVELLAVIIVLSIVLALVIPQLNSTINKSRIKTVETNAYSLARDAEKNYTSNTDINKRLDSIPCKDVNTLNNNYSVCGIRFDDDGVATVTLRGKAGGKFENIVCHGTSSKIECERKEPKRCTSESDTSYDDGTYIYTYNGDTSITTEGWQAVLKDKEYTGTITEAPCSYVNDKPIVSMRNMFYGSKAKVIDVSNFDLSNVHTIAFMFFNSSVEAIRGLNYIDTSNVVTMYGTFGGSNSSDGITFNLMELDLSSFNTSKVTYMAQMFSNGSIEKIIGLNCFDTSKVENMSEMFKNMKIKKLDLSNFDTGKVTDKTNMFNGASTEKVYVKDNDAVTWFSTGTSKPDTMSIVVKE